MAEMADETLTNDCPECGASMEVSDFMPFEEVSCPTCGAVSRVRVQCDHYHIQEMRGVGGMSQVFAAMDSHLKRMVALKVLNRENSSKEDRIVQFEREARLTASISHPNVVRVYSVGHAQGNFYIAMELVDGANLEELLRQQDRLPETQVLELAIQATEGLAAAQHVGLIHRDIKPGNILLTSEGKAKLVDFGLALVFEKDVDDSQEMWATPYYVPPEKLSGGVEDFRSDIYSLGSTFFHLLAGRPPYDSQTTSIDELKKLKSVPVRLGGFAPWVSAPTQEVVNRMIELNPDERFQSYDELLGALRGAQQRLAGPMAGTHPTSGLSRREEQRRKRTQMVSLAAVLALCVVGLVTWKVLSKPHQPTATAPVDGSGGGEGWSVSTVENDNVGERFLKARQLLTEGKFSESRGEFLEIFESQMTRQPTINWAAYCAALSDLLAGEPGKARELIRKMKENPQFQQGRVGQAGAFFQRVADHMLSPWPVSANQLDVMKKNPGWEAEALIVGLKNWEHGRFKDAVVFINEVRGSKPPQELAWLVGLNPVLGKYSLDEGTLAGVRFVDDFSRSTDVDSALAEARTALGQLRTEGRAKRLLQSRIVALEKIHANLVAAEQKAGVKALEERTVKELADLDSLAGRLAAFRAGYRFEEAMVELRAFTPTTAPAKEKHAILMWTWQGGVDFFTTLVDDLNTRGYRGNLQIREGAVVYTDINITKASRTGLVLGGRIGVMNAPIAAVPPAQLTNLAVAMMEKTTGEKELNKRRSLLALFSLHCGTADNARRWAATLEGDKEFTKQWKAATGRPD